MCSILLSHALGLETTTVFLRSDAATTIYFAACFVQLLFEGGYYSRAAFFLWKAWRRPRRLDRVRTSETVTVTKRCQ